MNNILYDKPHQSRYAPNLRAYHKEYFHQKVINSVFGQKNIRRINNNGPPMSLRIEWSQLLLELIML